MGSLLILKKFPEAKLTQLLVYCRWIKFPRINPP